MAKNRVRRVARGALWGLAAAHVAEAVVLRRRRDRITALYSPGSRHDLAGKLGVLAASGGDVDDATRSGAAHEMELDGVEAVDLVPGDLPAERALRLLRRVDPDKLVDDIMYSPGGAHELVALHPSLAERMRVDPREQDLDREAMVRQTVRAQRYAPASTVVRVAPELKAAPYGPVDRWRELSGLTALTRPFVELPPVLVGAELAQLAVLAAGILAAPPAGLAALAAWSAKPALVFGGATSSAAAPGGDPEGRALQPPDVGPASLRRFPRALAEAVRTAFAGRDATRVALERRLAEPPADVPAAAQLFREPVDRCPWCGSAAIVGRLDTDDLFQSKPGEFHLDVCDDCGLVFQNPQLTTDGLDYYYADFYEGIGEEAWETVFAGGAHHNEKRCDAIARASGPEGPKAWLDVGCGHGHFCLSARQRWPETRFEGADMSETVAEARRRGRIDAAHQGIFTELADHLPRTYDVVSMHHYLEHTIVPKEELAAVAKLLVPGGLLMIEVPDPDTPWNRRLGRFWYYWAQPQHLHMIRCEELAKHLESEGFEVVSVERAAATLGFDVAGSVALRAQSLAASSHLPWLPRPSPAQRLKRMAVVVGTAPVLLGAIVVDLVKDALPEGDRIGNAYRVVARAPGGADTPADG